MPETEWLLSFESDLSHILSGLPIAGYWIIEVTDEFPEDTGTLSSVTVLFEDNICDGQYRILGHNVKIEDIEEPIVSMERKRNNKTRR